MPGSLIFIFNSTSNFQNLNFNRPTYVHIIVTGLDRKILASCHLTLQHRFVCTIVITIMLIQTQSSLQPILTTQSLML